MDVQTLDFWVMIIIGVICGGFIGLERQMRGKPAGVRTSILICLGTAMFISLSLSESDAQYVDRTRVLGQVVTGIGFLGAGVILIREGAVMGITSAAVIWMLAAIGSLVGFQDYQEAIALSCTTVIVLIGIGVLEGKHGIFGRGIYAETPPTIIQNQHRYGRLQDFIDLAQTGHEMSLEVELSKRTATREIRNDKSAKKETMSGNYYLVARYEFRLLSEVHTIPKTYAQGDLSESPEEATQNLRVANVRLQVDYARLRTAGIVFEEKQFR